MEKPTDETIESSIEENEETQTQELTKDDQKPEEEQSAVDSASDDAGMEKYFSSGYAARVFCSNTTEHSADSKKFAST